MWMCGNQPQPTMKIYIFALCTVSIFLFALRCLLSRTWVPVSPNPTSGISRSSREQQAPPPRLSLALPGEGRVCYTCRAAETLAHSHVLLWSLRNIDGPAGELRRGQALEPVRGQGLAWIILSGLTA